MAKISAAMVKDLRDRTGLGMMECKKALQGTDGDVDKAIEEMRKASGMKAAKKAGRTAAEGVVLVKVADDNSYAVAVEVNSETDFAARDEGFLAFSNVVLDKAFAGKETNVETLMAGELNDARDALVQKIGENIGVRRVFLVEGGVVAAYVHSNNKIAAMVQLEGGNAETAKDIAMHVTAVNPQVVSKDDMPEDVVAKEKEIILAQPDMASKPAEIAEKMVVGRINKFLAENSLVEQAFVKNPELKVGQVAKDAGATVKSFTRIEVGEGIEVEEVDFAAEVAAQLKG
ncbi:MULTISPECIES: translation elongation factor Ts [unclassified Neptuniibacter]|jgi:elongation factor Ts|uniref:translation elongation factor Ts n=1 Tax=unclassified Neptuniibacter TaxID=2630693 RepID=UPI0026E1D3F8|nr:MULTISPECIES: translation elongation factor Ts [unclassified Neptuniibacter]MDO6514734.1 translation elongation factor Ts [Neptuniibacter sp. 2_MG-2023]MDO6593396.1 translation elongation factor Ts [Neptuniibacter sp. 1_MG-2023]